MHRLAVLVTGLVCLCCSAIAETLTFIAQPDPVLGETNTSWFIADNWFAPDPDGQLLPAGRVPLAGETAIITGEVDLGATGIRVKSLVLTNDATFTGGTVAVEQVRMYAASSFKDTILNLLTSLDVHGADCALRGGKVTILTIAEARLHAGASLHLANGAIVALNGRLVLSDQSRLSGTGVSPSHLQIFGVLSSTGESRVGAESGSTLVIDNSGIVRAQAATLRFEGEIEWQSSSGMARFDAADTNAFILLATPLQVPAATTSYFSGPGSTRLMAGADVQGAIRVGEVDASGEGGPGGQLVVEGTVSGAGNLWVNGNGTEGATLAWHSGRLSLPIDIAAGANMQIQDRPQAERILSSGWITNAGVCTLSNTSVAFESGAAFHNLPGATFELQGTASFSGDPAPDGGVFVNFGLFKKTALGLATFSPNNMPGPGFNNYSRVEIADGALELSGGTSLGLFEVGTGTSLSFGAGTHELRAGVKFAGGGPVRVSAGSGLAKLLVTGWTTAGEIGVSTNGIIAGQGIGSTPLLFANSLAMTGSGTLADLNATALNLELSEQAAVTNAQVTVATALFIDRTNAVLRDSTLIIGPGASAIIGSPEPSVPAALNLEHSVLLNSGELAVPANARLSGDATSALRIAGGAVLTGSGVVDCPTENSGTIHPSGVLTFALGKLLELESPGKLVLDLRRTNGVAETGQLRVLGEARLNGSLILQPADGFVPQRSESFRVVEFGNGSGQFARLEGEAPPGLVWTSAYSPDSVTVSLLRRAEIGKATLDNDTFSFPFGTAVGSVYLVQASSDLGTWETLQAVNGDGTIVTFTESPVHPRRFYRVLVQ